MKPRFVSAVAVLFCCAIFSIVSVFGYWRYKKGQAEDAAFQAQLLNAQREDGVLATHMPPSLSARPSGAPEVSASPPKAGR